MLVAIAIPVFTTQLEKSREATDLANIRSAYAEVMAKALTEPDADISASVDLKQQVGGWATTNPEVAGVTLTDALAVKDGSVTIAYTASTGKVTIGGIEVTGTIS